jgi:hypothetical protein
MKLHIIAVTSIRTGRSPPPPHPTLASTILPRQRYNDIAATPSAAFTATILTLSIAKSCASFFQDQ